MNRELENWQDRMPTLEEFDREVNRRLWRRRIKAAGEVLGTLAFLLLAVAAFALYLAATPDQMSAEYDYAAEETRQAGF